jgi:hypothetical protein
MRGSYPRKFSSKMALKNTSMNNQRNHQAKLGDTPLSTLILFLLKNVSNAHIYGLNQDRISLPVQNKFI